MTRAEDAEGGCSRRLLVVIDMQEVFRSPDSDWCVPDYDRAAEQVTRLADRFAGQVVHTRFVRNPDEGGAWTDYYDRWSSFRLPPDSPVWGLTLPVRAADHVVTLPTFSKWGSELSARAAGCDTLVVCGVATDCCVLATVLGAVDAGRAVVVVGDACAGLTDEAHQQALDLMSLLSPMVTVAATDEVLRLAR